MDTVRYTSNTITFKVDECVDYHPQVDQKQCSTNSNSCGQGTDKFYRFLHNGEMKMTDEVEITCQAHTAHGTLRSIARHLLSESDSQAFSEGLKV